MLEIASLDYSRRILSEQNRLIAFFFSWLPIIKLGNLALLGFVKVLSIFTETVRSAYYFRSVLVVYYYAVYSNSYTYRFTSLFFPKTSQSAEGWGISVVYSILGQLNLTVICFTFLSNNSWLLPSGEHISITSFFCPVTFLKKFGS